MQFRGALEHGFDPGVVKSEAVASDHLRDNRTQQMITGGAV